MTTSVLQAPGFQRHQVGDLVVTALNDGFIILPPGILQGIGVEEQDTLYRAAARRPPFATVINGYLPQSAGHTVLVDAGAGGFMGPIWASCRPISEQRALPRPTSTQCF